MPAKDKRVDAYIARSEAFAKPILRHLRALVHKACPAAVETMKWSFPHFDYHGILCSMASFKQHCAFGFWKASLMEDYDKRLGPDGESAMGHFGRLKNLKDLPADNVLLRYIKEAARLNEDGVKIQRVSKLSVKRKLSVPADLRKALTQNKSAQETFKGFSYSNRKDYTDWITDAKTEETRRKRLKTAVDWMSEGKIRNWKYAARVQGSKIKPAPTKHLA